MYAFATVKEMRFLFKLFIQREKSTKPHAIHLNYI